MTDQDKLNRVPIELHRVDRPEGPCWIATRNTQRLAVFEDEAAARLFRAAPALLEACELLNDRLNDLGYFSPQSIDAIAAAKAGTPDQFAVCDDDGLIEGFATLAEAERGLLQIAKAGDHNGPLSILERPSC